MAYASWSVVFGEQPSAAKWNILGTNDASFNDGTGIAVSAITPEKLLTGTGTSWAWTSWTPTFTNFTKGSATIDAKYKQIGKTVHFRLEITLSGSTMGTNPIFSLPVTAVSHTVHYPIGPKATLFDFGTGGYNGYACYQTTTTANILLLDGNNNEQAITSANPFTWANNDSISVNGTYEAA